MRALHHNLDEWRFFPFAMRSGSLLLVQMSTHCGQAKSEDCRFPTGPEVGGHIHAERVVA